MSDGSSESYKDQTEKTQIDLEELAILTYGDLSRTDFLAENARNLNKIKFLETSIADLQDQLKLEKYKQDKLSIVYLKNHHSNMMKNL